MPSAQIREAARRDLVDHFVYLAENAGMEVAAHFLEPAESSFGDLAGQPLMDAPVPLQNADLAGPRGYSGGWPKFGWPCRACRLRD